MTSYYVKCGTAGYGPDLDTDDEPYADIASLCFVIRDELERSMESENDTAHMHAENGDFEAAWLTHVHVEELDGICRNFDYERRSSAPAYVGNLAKLDQTMVELIGQTFPLDITQDGNTRLYVWEADDAS